MGITGSARGRFMANWLHPGVMALSIMNKVQYRDLLGSLIDFGKFDSAGKPYSQRLKFDKTQ